MAKIAYWLFIFFITWGIYLSCATAYTNTFSKKFGLDKQVLKAVHKPEGIEKLFGKTIYEYESGLVLTSQPITWESVLCCPGMFFIFATPATLLVYRKQLSDKLQRKSNKVIFALICLISIVSLVINARLSSYTF